MLQIHLDNNKHVKMPKVIGYNYIIKAGNLTILADINLTQSILTLNFFAFDFFKLNLTLKIMIMSAIWSYWETVFWFIGRSSNYMLKFIVFEWITNISPKLWPIKHNACFQPYCFNSLLNTARKKLKSNPQKQNKIVQANWAKILLLISFALKVEDSITNFKIR